MLRIISLVVTVASRKSKERFIYATHDFVVNKYNL